MMITTVKELFAEPEARRRGWEREDQLQGSIERIAAFRPLQDILNSRDLYSDTFGKNFYNVAACYATYRTVEELFKHPLRYQFSWSDPILRRDILSWAQRNVNPRTRPGTWSAAFWSVVAHTRNQQKPCQTVSELWAHPACIKKNWRDENELRAYVAEWMQKEPSEVKSRENRSKPGSWFKALYQVIGFQQSRTFGVDDLATHPGCDVKEPAKLVQDVTNRTSRAHAEMRRSMSPKRTFNRVFWQCVIDGHVKGAIDRGTKVHAALAKAYVAPVDEETRQRKQVAAEVKTLTDKLADINKDLIGLRGQLTVAQNELVTVKAERDAALKGKARAEQEQESADATARSYRMTAERLQLESASSLKAENAGLREQLATARLDISNLRQSRAGNMGMVDMQRLMDDRNRALAAAKAEEEAKQAWIKTSSQYQTEAAELRAKLAQIKAAL